MGPVIRLLCILLIALLSSGCVFFMNDRIHYGLDAAKHPPVDERACVDPEKARSPMFGIALSGGGSRAAVFAAASLEALWEYGLLDQITHISSVSGGSMASSYLVADMPTCQALQEVADREACWRAFFDDYLDAMSRNYLLRVELRQLLPNRFLSPTRRASSFEEELDKRYLHGKTFGEIPAGSGTGDEPARPVLLINATSYDSGRRFVFSNACLREPVPAASTSRRTRSQMMARDFIERDALRALSFSSKGCARPVPADFPVSLAVATSASFPPLMGPITIQAPATCQGGGTHYWHLGDGGIIENSGIDTLEEVVLRDRAVGGDLDRVFLLSIDAGKKTTAQSRLVMRNVKMWTDPAGVSTVVDAPRVAAREYHDLVWRDLRTALEGDGVDYQTLVLDYTMSHLDRWPASCDQMPDPPTKADFEAIGTDLEISKCHADLLEMAAHQLVHEAMNGETGRKLEKLGLTVRPVEE